MNSWYENLPSLETLAIALFPGIAWAYLCLFGAGYLKKYCGLKTAYTRKVFHFLIFMTVVMVHYRWGFVGVCIFGGATTLVLIYAIVRGAPTMLYEAIAREEDAPYRTYFIIAPYFATLAGGILSNFWAGSFAVAGYLVTGVGDAIAEPVGARFGKHRYTVPALSRVTATRSLEGSLAVFIVSMLALIVSVLLIRQVSLNQQHLVVIPLIALAATLVEAISPHGWDNTTLQIIPSLLASILF